MATTAEAARRERDKAEMEAYQQRTNWKPGMQWPKSLLDPPGPAHMADAVNIPRHVLDELARTPVPRPSLSVHEMERLAKAGVVVDVSKVHVKEEQSEYYREDVRLMRPLLDRLALAFSQDFYTHSSTFSYLAARPMRGGKIALMAITANGTAALIEEDAKTWPSDTLIAKLHLLLETEDKTLDDVGMHELSSRYPVSQGV